MMIVALLDSLINFFIDRSKNVRLVTTVHRSQRDLLERNFPFVGDNGQMRSIQLTDDQINSDTTSDNMHKGSESLYIP